MLNGISPVRYADTGKEGQGERPFASCRSAADNGPRAMQFNLGKPLLLLIGVTATTGVVILRQEAHRVGT